MSATQTQVARALGGVDVVVHLAAKVGLGVDLGDLDDYVSSNDLGTAVLVQEMARAGVGRLVVASSMVVYGEGAYQCAEHGSVQPAARREADLAAGRFEPGCPALRHSRSSPSWSPRTPQPIPETVTPQRNCTRSTWQRSGPARPVVELRRCGSTTSTAPGCR